MYKILNRSRAIQLFAAPGTDFPGRVDLAPLEVPIFRLNIINNLSFGPLLVRYNDKNGELILNGKSITIDFQKCHSYDQQNCLFPQGTIISLLTNQPKLTGFVYVTAYTYYWEV